MQTILTLKTAHLTTREPDGIAPTSVRILEDLSCFASFDGEADESYGTIWGVEFEYAIDLGLDGVIDYAKSCALDYHSDVKAGQALGSAEDAAEVAWDGAPDPSDIAEECKVTVDELGPLFLSAFLAEVRRLAAGG